MTRRPTAAEVGDSNIEYAAHPRTPGPSPFTVDLHLPRPRDVPAPEPADVTWLNWRPPGGWETRWEFTQLPPVSCVPEEAAIRDARERERRAEMVLLTGTGGP